MKIRIKFDPKNIEGAEVPWGPHGRMTLINFCTAVRETRHPKTVCRNCRRKIHYKRVNLTDQQRMTLDMLTGCESVAIEIDEKGGMDIHTEWKGNGMWAWMKERD